MKKKSIIGLFVSLLGLGMTTTSCEDMLTPDMDLYTEGFSGRDTVNFYYGILSNVQDMIENNILLGELRSDLVDTTSYVSDTVASVSNFDRVADGDNGLLKRAAYYNVINQCNFYLAKADTMAQKNNIYYMRREFAQVQMVRAWTYMQLVQNYGEVPFITKPVDNANTGWEKNPEEGFVNVDNLLDKLISSGLQRAYSYYLSSEYGGNPNYTSVENGAFTISPSKFVFQPDIIMGDLYLMRGSNTGDYYQAAEYYFNYIDDQAYVADESKTGNIPTNSKGCSLSSIMVDGRKTYKWSSAGNWTDFYDKGSSVGNEVITCVASAANTSFGTVLTRAAQIYGYDSKSSTSSSMTTKDDGTQEEVASGRISMTANYKNRQVTASQRYLNLCAAQVAKHNEGVGEIIGVDYASIGDGRINGSVAKVNTPVGDLPFITKRTYTTSGWGYTDDHSTSTSSFSYNYSFPVYRLRQIYLRFAEAVNRAGFPRYAYAILRDGLCLDNIPTLRYDSVRVNEDGTKQRVIYAVPATDGANYIDVDEIRRAQSIPFLSEFTRVRYYNKIAGIHELGTGESSDKDSLSMYDVVVGQRMAEEQARATGLSTTPEAVQRYVSLLQTEDQPTTGGTGSDDVDEDEILPADEPKVPENIGEQINAVETLICDEMALETAFEGNRFYDLTRIARHKNNDNWGFTSGNYGTNWFAWTVARRSVNLAPYAQPNVFNGALYNKLQNQNNWYLQNPQY